MAEKHSWQLTYRIHQNMNTKITYPNEKKHHKI